MMYRKIKPEQLLSQGNCAIFVEKGQLTILDIEAWRKCPITGISRF